MGNDLSCSFCGKGQNDPDVKKMIKGAISNTVICNGCVEYSLDIMNRDDLRSLMAADGENRLTPKDIVRFLDEFVIGQDDAKKTIANAVRDHYKRIIHNYQAAANGTQIAKKNVLILGPTGSGKTLLARTIAKMLNVPFAEDEATSLTKAGYKGRDIEMILYRLLQAADGDIERAQNGIIYIDEIDKISAKGGSESGASDEGVQQALLKMAEGTIVDVPTSLDSKDPKPVQIDTSQILFIVGGAFVNLNDILAARLKSDEPAIGFKSNVDDKNKVIPQTELLKVLKQNPSYYLQQAGMIPEFVGRFPVVTATEELTTEQLCDILTQPRDALVKQEKILFAMDEVDLDFTPDALKEMATIAKNRRTGARALMGVMEAVMADLKFELSDIAPGSSVEVTKDFVQNPTNVDAIVTPPEKDDNDGQNANPATAPEVRTATIG